MSASEFKDMFLDRCQDNTLKANTEATTESYSIPDTNGVFKTDYTNMKKLMDKLLKE